MILTSIRLRDKRGEGHHRVELTEHTPVLYPSRSLSNHLPRPSTVV